MRLSEAIRLGAAKRPQIRGTFIRALEDGQGMGSCAMGAAIEAVTGRLYDSSQDDPRTILDALMPADSPDFQAHYVVFPVSPNDRLPLNVAISQLNDRDGWTREAISDWLEHIGL